MKDQGTIYKETWGDETQEEAAERHKRASAISSAYYDLITENYESGWGRKFHFCRFLPGETIDTGLARHEHLLALNLKLGPGKKALDLGFGVGEPAREIALFSGAHVTGININIPHIARAQVLSKQAGIGEDKVKFQFGDFTDIPFPDNSFDAVYAIEATCYAANLKDVYSEAHRVLKPGGYFATMEFMMTPRYDASNPVHKQIKYRIMRGTGCHDLVTEPTVLTALKDSGLQCIRHEDIHATSQGGPPWWAPIDGNMAPFWAWRDKWMIFKMKEWFFHIWLFLVWVLACVGLMKWKDYVSMEELCEGVWGMRDGGREGIFTPDFMFVARKPGGKDD
ncbi:S-adenosyl-L-methionine-dependent methyltransferase [Glarea lozoyensis ATCC 20868]|uniref:Sterol 24-C-methyltransferase n=2 Tax=Glarea lozoyensis TaxID=101852 RepID=S3D658_GLAL2|nr:S-adenosyl-L-methionine-dependent methyltransferase [Glarea lozoyensis ATCC 20868]EHL01798.1 putative Sterol 24-C-methyltransferase [Glarea lozoyensis 74030]EPE27556.1 S-adenosyl-L-methionine-dependent methyltransferase [Glarea lozoyensis ATCC 20868]